MTRNRWRLIRWGNCVVKERSEDDLVDDHQDDRDQSLSQESGESETEDAGDDHLELEP